MKNIQLLRFWRLFLLVLCLSLKADNRDYNAYVYLHDADYNVSAWVDALVEIDDDVTSPVHALKDYMIGGELVAISHEVMHVLKYGQSLLAHKCSVSDDAGKHQRLVSLTNSLMDALDYNILTLDSAIIELVPLSDGALMEPILRQNVLTNISMVDSHIDADGMPVGNFMKINAAGNVRRFIHNYGQRNTFAGIRAGNFSMADTAVDNTAVGTDALRFNTSGIRYTAIGKDSARASIGGARNVAIGYKALENVKNGSQNVAVGDSALVNLNSSVNDTSFNTAIGRNALRGLKDGNNNVAVGSLSGYSPDVAGYDGSGNVFFGNRAGNSMNPGNNNIYVGNRAGSLASNGSSNICIANLGAFESNTIRIGIDVNQTRFFIAGIRDVSSSKGDAIPLFIDSLGQLGMVSSSRRFKNSINQMGDESEVIYSLRPVSFVYKNDEAATKQYGLIAEEVDQCFPRLVVKDDNGMPYTVRYDLLPVLLLNEIKKHQYDIQCNKYDIQQNKQNIETQQHNICKEKQSMQEQKDILNNLFCVVNDLQNKAHSYMKNNNYDV